MNDLEAAKRAIEEWNENYRQGGEMPYPHWADEIIKKAQQQGGV